jgi:hypothetical protein
MKRIAVIVALLAALATAVPASGSVLLAKSCGTTCSTLSANGKGWLSVVASGDEHGSISCGTVWVRDRSDNGHKDFSVTGWQTRVSIGDDGWKLTSKHAMSFDANTKFWVKLQTPGSGSSCRDPGIAVSGVFVGSGEIAGTGKYAVNYKPHSWPTLATDLHF